MDVLEFLLRPRNLSSNELLADNMPDIYISKFMHLIETIIAQLKSICRIEHATIS